MTWHNSSVKARYHKLDGWRGYTVPGLAVAGASDTGTWADSPCPTPQVLAEIERFRKECLRSAGIASRLRGGESSNVFCGKRWVTVAGVDFQRAAQLSLDWIAANDRSLRFLHDADQGQLGMTVTPGEAS